MECLPVSDAKTRRAFADLTSVSFDIPYMIANAVYSRPEAWNGDYQGFVGLVDGRVVAIAAMVAASGVIGVYSLATQPQYRRQGYGEAVLRAAAARTSERTGITRMCLQSTEAGYNLYTTMGFRDSTRYVVYLTR